MIATFLHHKHGRPICPYCGGTKVREIGEEGTEEHRHVCMDPHCPEIAHVIALQRASIREGGQ